ncbi:MAG: HAMP domain-containing histidine kinase, partial [Kordiimonadaceae bacterium]|nr:HAMP domain-containing histidine kinase [Kordiimonadaceae bacterium]
ERSIRYTLKTRRLEQELQEAKDAAVKADHAKAHFLSHLSHDLKTPLNTIAGFSEMISRNQENLPDSREFATQILSSANHLEDMIEDLLALTYFDLQKAESIPRHYFIKALVEEALALTQGAAQDRKVQIKPLYSEDNLEIYGDRKAIKRILVNLITVSIKHSHQGGTIFIACGQDEKGISILVSDDGTGIDQHTIKEVINAGPYAADAYTTSSNGIGLSLSIVHQYVLMHSGKMLVDSKIDGGTIVEIFFPHDAENPNVI